MEKLSLTGDAIVEEVVYDLLRQINLVGSRKCALVQSFLHGAKGFAVVPNDFAAITLAIEENKEIP